MPIFGNIFELGEKPHRPFTNLCTIYGPILTLKLGTVTTIVVSSSEVAKYMFLKNDQTLCNRTIPDYVKAGNHDKLSISYVFRKISAVELLSTQSLDASQAPRQAKVQQLLEYIQECCKIGKPIDIGRAAFTTSLSLLSNTFFTKELAHHSSSVSQEFKQLMWCIMEEIGRPNYADYFPILGYINPFWHTSSINIVFQNIIRERLTKEQSCTSAAITDVLDTLLNLYKQKQLRMDEINHLHVDIFDSGTDTTASTLEWAMTELVKNSKIMTKAQQEIKQTLGNDCSIIKESDISKLLCLQAIIKETLPTVFSLPRKANSDVQLYGYVEEDMPWIGFSM